MLQKLDPFRARYTPQSEEQRGLVDNIKSAAEELYELIELSNEYDARCSHIAKTKLEECIMWAVKGVTSVREKA